MKAKQTNKGKINVYSSVLEVCFLFLSFQCHSYVQLCTPGITVIVQIWDCWVLYINYQLYIDIMNIFTVF